MKKITKAIIPVAGLGTRFLPATKAIPKELLPIVDKPTLEYILNEVKEAGIKEVLLITRDGKEMIKAHFSKNEMLEELFISEGKDEKLKLIKDSENLVKLSYIKQDKPLGSGHAINLGKDFVNGEPFAVLYGDDLMDCEKPALKQLVEVYEKTNANVIGTKKVSLEDVSSYGILKFKDDNEKEIETIIEKPKKGTHPSLVAGLGRYIVSANIFKHLEKLSVGAGGEYQFTDAMKLLMEEESFYNCPIKGDYYDIGSKLGYVKANVAYGLKNINIKEDLLKYLKEIN